MATIIIGSARHDERGKLVGGSAGDQTQKSSTNDTVGEVSMQNFYLHSKGWYIIRPKSEERATLLAEAMRTACNNKCIGYDQNQRGGVVTKGINTKVNTECDCSSLVRACIISAYSKDVGNFTTATEASVLSKSGLFFDKIAYVSQTKTPLYNGDILVTKTKGHTVIVISGNPRETSTKYYGKYTGSSSSIITALQSVGEKDTTLVHRTKIAKANGIASYSGTATQNLKMVNLLKSGKLIKA